MSGTAPWWSQRSCYFPLLGASAVDDWKHCGKRRNCSKQVISSFATIFCTSFSNIIYIFRDFPRFCLDVIKVVCCKFVIYGKREIARFEQFLLLSLCFQKAVFTKRAISPFATMFSTFCHRLSIQLWIFSIFWQNTSKVVCCRIVVWGKGLKMNNLVFSHQ